MRDEPQFAALAAEGELMLRALVEDLAAVPGVEVAALLDARLDIKLPVKVHGVAPGDEFWEKFRRAAHEAEAVWPVAPERDAALERITKEV